MISAKLLQLAVDTANDGIVICEHEGEDDILIYANAAFERLTGFGIEDILYRDCRFLQRNEGDQTAREAIRNALLQGQPCREILRNYRKDGSAFWNELSITPVFNEAEKRMYFIGIQRDVSEYVLLQQKVVELQAELAQARREISSLQP